MSSTFGKFRLLQRIGGGRLSQVFRIAATSADEPHPLIALKRVHPALIGEPVFVQLVVREAGLLTRLAHPSLCRCHELGVIDGSAFLTLDLIVGCTLRALMRRLSQLEVRLPASAVAFLGARLAEVLDYVHRRNSTPLVHLDLSPQNVMVKPSGEVMLIDFGIARFLDGHDPPPLGGRIAGTIGYMSPEQAAGRPIDARADQFGLGILLAEALSGTRLYRGNTAETWRRMRCGQISLPAELVQMVQRGPGPLLAVIRRLLQPRPEDRFFAMADVIEELAALSSSVRTGRRPLAALVRRLLSEPDFDPFDIVSPRQRESEGPADVPAGESPGEDYAEIRIQMERGDGSPVERLRAVLPASEGGPPVSPFLETVAEDLPATAGQGP